MKSYFLPLNTLTLPCNIQTDLQSKSGTLQEKVRILCPKQVHRRQAQWTESYKPCLWRRKL